MTCFYHPICYWELSSDNFMHLDRPNWCDPLSIVAHRYVILGSWNVWMWSLSLVSVWTVMYFTTKVCLLTGLLWIEKRLNTWVSVISNEKLIWFKEDSGLFWGLQAQEGNAWCNVSNPLQSGFKNMSCAYKANQIGVKHTFNLD